MVVRRVKGRVWRPIYQDVDSWWAVKRGIYVRDARKEGIDLFSEAVGIATLILYEYHGGYGRWTFDHFGRRKRMNTRLAKLRLRYIRTLAKRHGAKQHEYRRISKLVAYALKTPHLKSKWREYAEKSIAGYNKLDTDILEIIFSG